ncbi:hypothetical protein [Nocardioides pakistanensis]
MKKLLPIGSLGLAGLVGVGLMAMPGASVAAGPDDEVAVKREDNVTELVLVSDDDDDDTMDDTNTDGIDTNTGASRSTSDNTRSNFTRVSRDRDLSRSDLTKDFTFDGPGDTRTRDWTANHTNDRSRNDTRGRS